MIAAITNIKRLQTQFRRSTKIGTELCFGNNSEHKPDWKQLSSWMNKHNQGCYTTTVSSPNAMRLGPLNQPARSFKQKAHVSKTYLKTSCSIKGNRTTPRVILSVNMRASVGHPPSDKFTLLFHCKLLFKTQLWAKKLIAYYYFLLPCQDFNLHKISAVRH